MNLLQTPCLGTLTISLQDTETNYSTVKAILKDENVFAMSSVMGHLGEMLTRELRLANNLLKC